MPPNITEWCEEIARLCWVDSDTLTKPNIHERLLAITTEMGELRKSGSLIMQGKQVRYWSIDQVENKLADLCFKYRVLVLPDLNGREHYVSHNTKSAKDGTILGIVDKENSIIEIKIEYINIDRPEDRVLQVWADDGDDLTKAGSFAIKYAYCKFFHVADFDEEKSDSKVGRFNDQASGLAEPPARSAVQSRAIGQRQQQRPAAIVPPPPGSSQPAQATPRQVGEAYGGDGHAAVQNGSQGSPVDPATSQQKMAALNWYAMQIPDSVSEEERRQWSHQRIIMELGLYERRRRDDKLSAAEQQMGNSHRWVFAMIDSYHKRPSACGDNCSHRVPVAQVFTKGGKVEDYLEKVS